MNPQNTKYGCVFRMRDRPFLGAILVFDDGQACIQRHRASPYSPIVVELEGQTPNDGQIELCQHIWKALAAHFNFSVASFDENLLPYAHRIRSEPPVIIEQTA